MAFFQKILPLCFGLWAGVCFAGGLSAWFQTTPGGSSVEDDGQGLMGLYCSHGGGEPTVNNLRCWFFYKNHIVGEYTTTDSTTAYFVVDEKTCAVERFGNEAEFKRFLRLQKLQPWIWKRWYKGSWGFFNTEDPAAQFGMVLFLGPLLAAFYLGMLLLVGFSAKFRLRNPMTIALIVITAIIGLRGFLDHYPQSF